MIVLSVKVDVLDIGVVVYSLVVVCSVVAVYSVVVVVV